MTIARIAFCMSVAVLSIAGAATAQQIVPAYGDQPGAVITLRGGVKSKPDYFGSDDVTVAPDLGFSLDGLTLRNGFSMGDGDYWSEPFGLGVGPSIRYVPFRDSSDHDALDGMSDIDAAIELGIGLTFNGPSYEFFGNLRRGYGGHEGWVGEAGMDYYFRPGSGWTFTVGPRLFWGDDEYAETYFSVLPRAATASRSAFDADGGLLSAGAEVGASYQFNDDWGVEGTVTWDRYRNDAADSPVIESEDNWTISLGVTRTLRLRF